MKPSFLVLDIETILDPALPIAESSEAERLPAPPHHQIVAIGALWLAQDYTVKKLGIVGENKDEAGMLHDFAQFLDDKRPCLVTYNGRGFDLPVIVARSLRHGVVQRHYYQGEDVRYRFSPKGHLDLMDFIADFGAAKPARLDVVAKLCGMPGKVGVDGKDVGPLVHSGRRAEVLRYCLCDVVQTAGVFLRLEYVRGAIALDAYQHAMGDLIKLIRTDERVEPVRPGLDEARLMLGAEPERASAEPLSS